MVKLDGYKLRVIIFSISWIIVCFVIGINNRPTSNLVSKTVKTQLSLIMESTEYKDNKLELDNFISDAIRPPDETPLFHRSTIYPKGFDRIMEPIDVFNYVVVKHKKLYVRASARNFDKILFSLNQKANGKSHLLLPELGKDVINSRSFMDSLYQYYLALEEKHFNKLKLHFLRVLLISLFSLILIIFAIVGTVWIEQRFEEKSES
jgi:hypothetical protein